MKPSHSFTGRRRPRQTRASVKWGDRVARLLITAGGLGTIVAVLSVCAFLLWAAVPLFLPAEIEGERGLVQGETRKAQPVVAMQVDDELVIAWSLRADGALSVERFDTREVIARMPAPPGAPVTAHAVSPLSETVVIGRSDGSIQTGKVAIVSDFYESDEVPEDLLALKPREVGVWEGSTVVRTLDGLFRVDTVICTWEAPVSAGDAAIRKLDFVAPDEERTVVCSLDVEGRSVLHVVRREDNFFTGEVKVSSQSYALPESAAKGKALAFEVFLTQLADQVYFVWEDGRFRRLSILDPSRPVFLEDGDFVEGEDRIGAIAMVLGRQTFAIGTKKGRLSVWFGMKPGPKPGAGPSRDDWPADGTITREARVLSESGAEFRAFAIAERSRILLAVRADGAMALYQVTTGEKLLEAQVPAEEAKGPIALAISPREDAISTVSAQGSRVWDVDLAHPDVNLRSVFRPVHYEGYAEAAHVWQSSSGSDSSEPKFGLMPLILGTLKATFYALLFGVPVALLAALYCSEYLGRRARSRIKPAIEMMASLPSVVLGFLAALVFAPLAERVVPALLSSFATVPLALIMGAFIWQLLPRAFAIRLAPYRPWFMALAIALGLSLAFVFGPLVEDFFFGNDIMAWLDGQRGEATGGWMLLTVPISALVVGIMGGRASHPWLVGLSQGWSREQFSKFEVLRCLILTAVILVLAWLVAWLIDGMGFDPRGKILDTYAPRNALVVGFVMGFAVIPIIFTIAEDALTAVPAHLRAASLSTGATPWQTATRIIIPTAASGLFSAVMIGLGRAVGETMIVLMAAGNTPIMEFNVFSGFRTLAANIAVEMPEAPKDGTHYHTLFLAALVLFTMTFIVNAVAESVRQRFRKRAFRL